MTFKQALTKSIDEHPEWGMYIHLCKVLQESGAKKPEIMRHFTKYMPKDEFDRSERGELVDYLVKIADPIVE